MKKLFSIGLPLVGLIVFSFATAVVSDSELRSVLDDLLQQRTSILESAYTGALSYEEVEAQLPAYVAQPLLGQDLETLKDWGDSDYYDHVSDFRIDWCAKVSENDYGIVTRAKITWIMYDLEGEYDVTEEYLLVLEKGEQEGDYKLCEMNMRQRPYS